MTAKERTYAFIMAGGVGKRFWPVGRRHRPKQLLPMGGRRTLLEDTLRRLDPVIPPERQWIGTNEEVRESIEEILGPESPRTFVIEPEGRNTTACVALAALKLHKHHPGAIMAVLPADQRFRKEAVFRKALAKAITLADKKKKLVTFGIPPTRVETGYGYIEVDPLLMDPRNGAPARRFVEKPPEEQVRQFLSAGNFYWNSGMFVWRVDVILDQMRRVVPDVIDPLSAILPQLETDEEEDALAEVFPELPAISIDHGVLERSAEVWVLPLKDAGWTDLGSWTAVYDALPKDGHGNVAEGVHVMVDSRNNLVINETAQAVALVGLEDHMVLVTRDVLLVGHKRRDQDVKKIVEKLADLGLHRLE